MYDEPGARTSPQRIRHWLDLPARNVTPRRWTLSGISETCSLPSTDAFLVFRETCSLPSYVLRMLIQGCTLNLHHSHTRPFTDIPGYVMRSRGGGHALLGSTDWAVAVRPCMYACMCPATLAHSRLMHACLTLTLTCGSDYSDGVAPMPHACMHGLTQSLRHRALRAHAHASFTVALIPPYASADYSITRTLIFEAWVMQAIRQRMQGLHLPLGSTPS